MTTFERDRDLIASLCDGDAINVLGMLDRGVTYSEAPSRFKAALAAAQRCPEVARYFLVEKTQRFVGEQIRGIRSIG